MVERRESSDFAILSCEPRRRGSVSRLWRIAGQQLMGGRFAISGGYHKPSLGKYVQRRRLLDVSRSGGQGLHLRGVSGWRNRPRESQHTRSAQHQAAPELQREAALQLEHADRAFADRKGNRLHRRAISISLARSRAELGANLSRPDDERSGQTKAG